MRILRGSSSLLAPINSNFSIYDADDSKRLLGMIISDLNLDPKKFSPRGVGTAISNFKNELISPEEAVDTAPRRRAVGRRDRPDLRRVSAQAARGQRLRLR